MHNNSQNCYFLGTYSKVCGGQGSFSTKTLKCLRKRNNLESKYFVSSYNINFPHLIGLSSRYNGARVRRKLGKSTSSSTKMAVICLHFADWVNFAYHMITGCEIVLPQQKYRIARSLLFITVLINRDQTGFNIFYNGQYKGEKCFIS